MKGETSLGMIQPYHWSREGHYCLMERVGGDILSSHSLHCRSLGW